MCTSTRWTIYPPSLDLYRSALQPAPFKCRCRELEIARLAASGSSNPEIAATLFLSRKTVERHVSAALAKIGARNRTELAARLASAAGAPDDPQK